MKYAVILLLLLLSYNNDEPILPKEEEEAVKFPEEIIGWEGTMAFYYRGEKYESRFYHNKSNLNRITLEDQEANELYATLCWVSQSVIMVVKSSGTVNFYDKSPGGLPTDENGFTTFYYEEIEYTSRFWYDKKGNLVFENEEANEVYASICNSPDFGMFFPGDGTVIFDTEPFFPRIPE